MVIQGNEYHGARDGSIMHLKRRACMGSMTHMVLPCAGRLSIQAPSDPAVGCSGGLRLCSGDCQSSLLCFHFSESQLGCSDEAPQVIRHQDSMHWQRRFWSCCRMLRSGLWQTEVQLAPAITDS